MTVDLRSLGIIPRHDLIGTQRLPCPRCDRGTRDRALALTLESDGGFVFYCHRCNWRGGSLKKIHAGGCSVEGPRFNERAQERITAATARCLTVAQEARTIWRNARPAPMDHPYLVKKRLAECGLRFMQRFQNLRNALLVPMRDRDGAIVSLQGIDEGGGKRFLWRGQTKGAFALVDLPCSRWRRDVAPTLIGICEGYATAVSFTRMYSDHRGVAAMSAGNLVEVAKIMHERFPRAQITIGSDQDRVGLVAGARATKAVGGRMWLPGDLNDFSDLELADAQASN